MNGAPLSSENGAGLALIAAITGGLVALYYLYYYSSKKHSKSLLPNAPCSFLEAMQGISGTKAPYFVLQLARQVNSSSYRIPLPVSRVGCYVIGDYDLARAILKDPRSSKPRHIYQSFEGISGRSIMFTRNDAYMKTLRKGTAHAFASAQVARMKQVANHHVDEWIRKKRDAASTPICSSFDPALEMNRITFSVICEAGFEYSDVTDEEYEHFSHHVEIALKEFTLKQSVNPFRRLLWTLIPGVREALQSAEECMKFTRKLLQHYKERKKLGTPSHDKSLIRLLVDNVDQNDDEQIAGEMISWLVAGHDTTGYSLSNALVLLAKYPDMQTKLRNDKNGEYYGRFVKELTRFIPVAAMGSIRATGRDHTTKDGRVIPASAVCFLPQYVTHRSMEVFGPTVDQFDPDRWIDPTPAMLDSILTFSLGPRNCPGQVLATAELQTSLPKLLAEFEFLLEDEGEMDFFLTLKFMNAKLKAGSFRNERQD